LPAAFSTSIEGIFKDLKPNDLHEYGRSFSHVIPKKIHFLHSIAIFPNSLFYYRINSYKINFTGKLPSGAAHNGKNRFADRDGIKNMRDLT
jgi:hypothetical protein